MKSSIIALAAIVPLFISLGCCSPYYADQGALAGGLAGGGIGAAIGDAHGNAGAGALLGSALGAVSGATIGQGLDEIEARNRALIEAKLGRRLAGAATIADVVAMSQAGLSDEVIITHIRAHGMARQVSAAELIALKQQGLSDGVMRAMQEPPPPVAVDPRTRPVIVPEHYYGRPYPPSWHWQPYHHWHPHHHRHHFWRHRPAGLSWGVSVGN